MAQNPIVRAMLLAERVYTDVATGQHVIAGTFNEYTADTFPTEFAHRASVFMSVTEFDGKMPITLRFVDLQTNEVLHEAAPLVVESADRLLGCEMTWELPPFDIPHPGLYVFEAYVEEESIGSVRLIAHQRSSEA
ncbi:MAG: hypothetical protein AAB341_01515 [Planctomycetota bacterium]